ncbi:hypothetical protein HK096_011153, partial [Nowakowskiella sp. JEL0078]
MNSQIRGQSDIQSPPLYHSDDVLDLEEIEKKKSPFTFSSLLKYLPLILIIGFFVSIFLHPAETKHLLFVIMKYVDEHRVPGSILFLIFFALSTSLLIPATPTSIAAGIIFRPLWLSILLVLVGFQIGLAITWTAGKTWLRPWVEAKAKNDVRFIAVDRAVAKEGFKIVILLRLSPIIPFGLNNYILSMTMIPFWGLVWSTLIGNIPGTILYCFMGSVIGSLADEYEIDPHVKWIMILFSFVFLTGSVFYITLVAKRALRQAMALPKSRSINENESATELDDATEPLLSVESASQTQLRSRSVVNSESEIQIVVNENENEEDFIIDEKDLISGVQGDSGYTPQEQRLLWWTTVLLSVTLFG